MAKQAMCVVREGLPCLGWRWLGGVSTPGSPSEAPSEPCLLTVSIVLVLAPTLPGLLTLTLLTLWALTLLINTPKNRVLLSPFNR